MKPPDFEGPFGRAWRVAPMPEAILATRPDWRATLAAWLLHVPGAHPVWHSYVMAVIHLRDIPGVRPPHKSYPEAEHELMLLALDPSKPYPDVDDAEKFQPAYLTPANLVEQFRGINDAQAIALTEGLARAFLVGVANPDTDYRTATRQLLRGTVEHLALGGHPTEVA